MRSEQGFLVEDIKYYRKIITNRLTNAAADEDDIRAMTSVARTGFSVCKLCLPPEILQKKLEQITREYPNSTISPGTRISMDLIHGLLVDDNWLGLNTNVKTKLISRLQRTDWLGTRKKLTNPVNTLPQDN